MAGRYKAYPAYKDSGVEWLGEIPEGWGVSKLKRLTDFQVGWTPPTGNENNFVGENLWANISDLKEKFLSNTANRISDKAAAEASMDITPKGSLLYSFKLSVGAVSFVEKDMYTNEAIASFLTTSKLPLAYLFYALPIFVIENASTNIYGAKILNQELIKNANLIELPYKDAEKIAQFLDYETAKIDALIAKQEQLIELLKEKRQAVISHAVTKGLNPDAPMKDSGVEWLGQVPEHWEVVAVRNVTKFVSTGSTPKREESFTETEEVNWFTPGDFLSHFILTDSEKYISRDSVIKGDAKLYPANSVVIIGIGATLGKVAVINKEFSCNQQINVVVPNEKIESHFLAYSLLAQKEQMQLSSNSSTIGIMNQDKTKSLKILAPPISEQLKIINFIRNELEKFDSLESKVLGLNLLLQERKTALISAAVTGKIDVRDWQPPSVG